MVMVVESYWAPSPGAGAHLGGLDFPPLLGNICVDGGHVGTRPGSARCQWLSGTGGPSRATGGSPGASTAVTGIYLVASVQQHPRGGQDVHGVEVEGAGRRVVGSLGNLLPEGERRGRTSPCGASPRGLRGVGD